MLIDTHNHLTWGVDDGIKTEKEAFTILRQAQKDGIEAIVATPHFYPEISNDVLLLDRIQKVKRIAKQFNIEIYEGCELMLRDGYVQTIENNEIITLANTDYVLVEFDQTMPLPSVEESVDMLYELISRNYIPVVAHVERYFEKNINYEYLQCWEEIGCIFQVNRSSIVGVHGRKMQKQALELVEKGFVHLIATDTHSHQRRMCKLSDSYEIISNRFNDSLARKLHAENPRRLLDSEMLSST